MTFLYNVFDIYKRKESFEYYGLDTDNEKSISAARNDQIKSGE